MIGPVVDSLLRQNVEVRYSAIFLLEIGSRPVLMYENCKELCSPGVMEQFLSGTYVLSPYYNALIGGRLSEFSVIGDYITDEGLGVWASGVGLHPHVSLGQGALTDEVCFARVVDGRAIIYLAMRAGSETAFSQHELANMKAAAPVVQGLLAHLLSDAVKPVAHAVDAISATPSYLLSPHLGDGEGLDSALGVDRCIESFFTETLSPREKSSIAMTLEGKSVFSIAADLGISPHTVRVHLRNAYGKLRVRNRLELVGMFVKRAGFKSKNTELVAGDA